MLREEIFAVKLIAFAFDGTLGAGGTAVICQTEMLRRDVAFPFILGAESAGAAGEGEGAGKGSGVCCCDVFAERG